MRYKKGLALFLAIALTVSMAPQTGSLVSASEPANEQEAGADTEYPEALETGGESAAAITEIENGRDGAMPEEGAEKPVPEEGETQAESGSSETETVVSGESMGAEDTSVPGFEEAVPEEGGEGTETPNSQDASGTEESTASEGELEAGDDTGISVMSLLPIEEKEATLELYGDDFSEVPIETILQRLRDAEGNIIEIAQEDHVALAYDEDDYIALERNTGKVDLSSLAGKENAGICLIIGKGTQLDANATRYIVQVDFYSARFENDITYNLRCYPEGGGSYWVDSGTEYGAVTIDAGGLNVPVTLVRFGYPWMETGGESELKINSKIANKEHCGDDIQVSVYQMSTFLGAYHGDTQTLDGEAVQEDILHSYKRGKYAELDKNDPLASDNLFCIVYTDTATGKVVEYQGLACIVSSEELFLKGDLYDREGEDTHALRISPARRVYAGSQWDVNVNGEPGNGSVEYSTDSYIYENYLPAGYPGDKTYYYIIENSNGMIDRVEVCDSEESWSGTDITEEVLYGGGETLPQGYEINCGAPVYFTVYTVNGMTLRYYVNVRASGETAWYSYTYKVRQEPNGEVLAASVEYKADEKYEDTGISVTPVVIYPENAELLDLNASCYVAVDSGNLNNKVDVAVYTMTDFLECYDAESGEVSGLEEKAEITEQILGQNAPGYAGKYADPDSPNEFAVVYSNPDDGKVMAYHGISVTLGTAVSTVEGELYTYVDGEKKDVSSNVWNRWDEPSSAEYRISLGNEYCAVSAAYLPARISRDYSLYSGYISDRDYYYIMNANPQIGKVTLVETGENNEETETDITGEIFGKGYPAKYDSSVNFRVYFEDGTALNYNVYSSGRSSEVLDQSYTYRIYSAGESGRGNRIEPAKTEYMPYTLPEGVEIPMDVTKVVFYAPAASYTEGGEYYLGIRGNSGSLSYISTEVYSMEDFMAYYQAKADGNADVTLEGKAISGIFSRNSDAAGHRGTYADLAEGADAISADNMFCIAYRHTMTGEIMACQGLLLLIKPESASEVTGTFYTSENDVRTKLTDSWIARAAVQEFKSSVTYGMVQEEIPSAAVSRYKSSAAYMNQTEIVNYQYLLPTGYTFDREYYYVMDVPGGDRSQVRVVRGRYSSLQEAEMAEDITDQILPIDEAAEPYGYAADYEGIVDFTAFVGNDTVLQFGISADPGSYADISFQYQVYAEKDGNAVPVNEDQIGKKVYLPCTLTDVDMPVTKVMYYVSDEGLKDTENWYLNLQPSADMGDVEAKVYLMKDFLDKKDDPASLGEGITDLVGQTGSGHEGAYQEPGENVLNADNLFCIVYRNKDTQKVISYQGLLFVINKETAPEAVSGKLYIPGEDTVLVSVDCEEEQLAFTQAEMFQFISGSSVVSNYMVDSVSYLYTLPAEYPAEEDFRYVLEQNAAVEKVVAGTCRTAEEAADMTDITADILRQGDTLPGGYQVKCDNDEENRFTVIFKDGSVMQYNVTVHATVSVSTSSAPQDYIPPKPSGDPYFKVTGAVIYDEDGKGKVYESGEKNFEYEDDGTYVTVGDSVYVVRNDTSVTLDTCYGYGYQTIFINDPNVDLENAAPIFELGKVKTEDGGTIEVKAYAKGRRQFSGKLESKHDFSTDSILYNVFIGSSLRNYQVTFARKTTGGANLFVNGPDTREVFLTQTHEYKHDILIANLGDEPLTDLKVELSKDAKNVRLDDYWTVGGDDNKELAAFDGVSTDSQYGELKNLAKIRLLPTGTDGRVEGSLTISGRNSKGEVLQRTITLTGWAINPEITTTELDDAVKFVPYSYVISTNNMHYEWNKVLFSIVEEETEEGEEDAEAKWKRLPEGLTLDEDTGEIYGVPQEGSAGEYDITVMASYSRTDLFTPSIAQFKLRVLENEDQTVYEASDSGYELRTPVGEQVGDYSYLVTEIRDWEFISEGEYGEFVALYLNGEMLIPEEEYDSESGSTKVVVFAQTFEDKVNDGRNTLAAEFRVNGVQKEGDIVNALHRTAQNFTLEMQEVKPSEKPGTTSEPGDKPGTTPEPGDKPGTTPKPGDKPGITPEPGDKPGTTPKPGDKPGTTPEPGDRPGTTPKPGDRPGTTPKPGDKPGTTPRPGDKPGTTPEPGDKPGTTPKPGDKPGTTPEPGGNSPGGNTGNNPGGNNSGGNTGNNSGGNNPGGSTGTSLGGTGGGAESSRANSVTIIARVVNPAGNPFAGYTMEIHSTPKAATLNKDGAAAFSGVEGGHHTLYVKDSEGSTVALKAFELVFGDAVSLTGNQISVKAGAAYTLSVQVNGSELVFLSLQEGDVYNVQAPKTGDDTKMVFWVVLAVLSLGACCGIFFYGKRKRSRNH